MKVEIDTINKTIKVLDNSTWEDVADMMVELPHYREYTFIPNTIINTITVKDNKPLEWVQPYSQPWTIQPSPYTYPYPFTTWCGTENTTISTNTNQVKN